MRRSILAVFGLLLAGGAALPALAQAPQLNIAACLDSTRGYLTPAGPDGGPARAGWRWQLVLDSGGSGLQPPDSTGGVTGTNVLLAEGVLGEEGPLPDTALAPAALVSFEPILNGARVYFRVFGASEPGPGTPFVETVPPAPRIRSGELASLNGATWACGWGGVMDRWIGPAGSSPALQETAHPAADSRLAEVEVGDRARGRVGDGSGTVGLHALRLELFEAAPPDWQGSEPPLPFTLALLADRRAEGGEGVASRLAVRFQPEELREHYGGQAEPEQARLFRRVPWGWQQADAAPRMGSSGWEVDLAGGLDQLAGRWALAREGAATAEEEAALPTAFRVPPVYPMPFNPRATVRVLLPERRETAIHVYNLLGRRVATLWDGALPGGTHRFTFSGGSHASGVYMLVVEAGHDRLVRKMVLLK